VLAVEGLAATALRFNAKHCVSLRFNAKHCGPLAGFFLPCRFAAVFAEPLGEAAYSCRFAASLLLALPLRGFFGFGLGFAASRLYFFVPQHAESPEGVGWFL